MRTIQAKILEIPGEKLNGKKTSRKTFPTIWVNLARLPSFLEILENVVTFATGSCRKFKWQTPHNAPCLTPKILHNHRSFPLGIIVVPSEIEDNSYAKFWGVNNLHYGLGENVN